MGEIHSNISGTYKSTMILFLRTWSENMCKVASSGDTVTMIEGLVHAQIDAVSRMTDEEVALLFARGKLTRQNEEYMNIFEGMDGV